MSKALIEQVRRGFILILRTFDGKKSLIMVPWKC